MENKKYVILNAYNIKGLGASEVSLSILDFFLKSNFTIKIFSNSIFTNYIKNNYEPKELDSVELVHCKSILEVWVKVFLIKGKLYIFSLGDYPIPFLLNQFIFFHQANLLFLKKKYVESFFWKIKRFFFSFLCKVSKGTIFVQTNFVRNTLLKNYSAVKHNYNVVVFSHNIRIPDFLKIERRSINPIRLFYPSSFYPHKNHSILLELSEFCFKNDVTIFVTIPDDDFVKFKHLSYVSNLGVISREESLSFLYNSSALFFPSYFESYGLPLIEARLLSIPIIAFDNEINREVVPDALFFQNSEDLSELITYLNMPQNRLIELMDFNEFLNKYFL